MTLKTSFPGNMNETFEKLRDGVISVKIMVECFLCAVFMSFLSIMETHVKDFFLLEPKPFSNLRNHFLF